MEIRQTKLGDADFRKINQVYYEAFPEIEQLPMWFMKMMVMRKKAEFVSLYNDDKAWVGFAFTIRDESLAYIFFLAIGAPYRNQGYGSIFLDLLKRRYIRQKLGLSAERPMRRANNNEQRRRRQAFYARNGFVKAGFYTKEMGSECYDFLAVGEPFVPAEYVGLMNRAMFPFRHRYLPLTVRKDD